MINKRISTFFVASMLALSATFVGCAGNKISPQDKYLDAIKNAASIKSSVVDTNLTIYGGDKQEILFVKSNAKYTDSMKNSKINQTISLLGTEFSQDVYIKDDASYSTIPSFDKLVKLPDGQIPKSLMSMASKYQDKVLTAYKKALDGINITEEKVEDGDNIKFEIPAEKAKIFVNEAYSEILNGDAIKEQMESSIKSSIQGMGLDEEQVSKLVEEQSQKIVKMIKELVLDLKYNSINVSSVINKDGFLASKSVVINVELNSDFLSILGIDKGNIEIEFVTKYSDINKVKDIDFSAINDDNVITYEQFIKQSEEQAKTAIDNTLNK